MHGVLQQHPTNFIVRVGCYYNTLFLTVQKQFLKTIEANISPSSCICKVCADDVKRNVHEYDYTRQWRKTKPKCKVIGCKNVHGIKLCNVTNNAKIEQLLELEKTTTGITLCTDHYNVVYRSLPEKVNL